MLVLALDTSTDMLACAIARVDGGTVERLRAAGWTVDAALSNNDAWHALSACGGLIVTGPTGTNVNDLSVALIGRQRQARNR